MCSATVQLKYTQVELLTKRLSQCLTVSDAKRLIRQGKVFVNGRVAQRNALITNNCVVTIDEPNSINIQRVRPQLWIAYKSRGMDSTNINNFISHINPTLKFRKLIPVNKLSLYSQGIILMTNDGSFAQKIKQLDTGFASIYYIKLYNHLHEVMSVVKYLKRILPLHWISLVRQGWRSVWLKCIINDFSDKNLIDGFRRKGLLPSKVRLESIGPYKINKVDRAEILPVKLTNKLMKIAKGIEKSVDSITLVPMETDGLWPPKIISSTHSLKLIKHNTCLQSLQTNIDKLIDD